MGQYFKPLIVYPDGSTVNAYSYDFGCGSKLMEYSWIGNEFVNVIYSFIYRRTRKIAWIGDYSLDDFNEKTDIYTKNISFAEFEQYYTYAWNPNTEIHVKIPSSKVTEPDLNRINISTKDEYLVNHTLGEYLDLGYYINRCIEKTGTWKGYCVDPLPRSIIMKKMMSSMLVNNPFISKLEVFRCLRK